MGKSFIKSIALFTFLFVCFAVLPRCKNESTNRNPYGLQLVTSIDEYHQQVQHNQKLQMLDIEQSIPGVLLDIRYATPNNFTSQVVYTSAKAFARKPVVEALAQVQDSLADFGLGLKVYDAYRPYAATLKFYEVYPDTNFVANPRNGSRHNRGCAIDISLINLASGAEIPMPTDYDTFNDLAHPEYAQLSDTVLSNRQLLFDLMAHFGFKHYPTEWWHFDYQGWEDFPLMDLSFEELTNIK